MTVIIAPWKPSILKNLPTGESNMLLLARRLNTRIILIVSCILFATGITYGWMTARNQTASLLASMRVNSTTMAKNFADSCARYLLVQDYAELETFLLKSAELSDIRRIQLCEPDGALIWDVFRTANSPPQARTGIERITPPSGLETVITTESNQMVVWQPVVAGNVLGWVKVEYSLSAIKDAQAKTWERTLFMSVAWVASSAVLIILVLRPIIRSIKRLTAFAIQLDDHKGAQIALAGQPVEIADLGASLNNASIKLLSSERLLLDEQERLRKSEESHRRLLETVQEGIWVIDTEAITTFVNPRMAEILGYTSGEMLGKPLFFFMDEQGQQIAEDNIARRKQGISEQHDFEFIRKDGMRIYTRLETGPIFDDAGQYAGSIAAIADITERKKAELQLYASEQAFRALVENSPDVIIRYDREGRRIYVNPEFERVNHLTAEQVIGKKPAEIATELAPVADEFTEKLMSVMESGENSKIDLSWIKDGKPLCWYVRVVPEFDADGTVVSALTIWSDISERKQIEEQIRTLNEKLEQRVEQRTAELNEKNGELERMNRIFVGRELRMIELKERIKELESQRTGVV
jgi:PAS domain S-box-containing protein